MPVTVPKGAVVTVAEGPMEGTRLIDVHWNGQQAVMFMVDLQERRTSIDSD